MTQQKLALTRINGIALEVPIVLTLEEGETAEVYIPLANPEKAHLVEVRDIEAAEAFGL